MNTEIEESIFLDHSKSFIPSLLILSSTFSGERHSSESSTPPIEVNLYFVKSGIFNTFSFSFRLNITDPISNKTMRKATPATAPTIAKTGSLDSIGSQLDANVPSLHSQI